jgi:hypothetical protein
MPVCAGHLSPLADHTNFVLFLACLAALRLSLADEPIQYAKESLIIKLAVRLVLHSPCRSGAAIKPIHRPSASGINDGFSILRRGGQRQ